MIKIQCKFNVGFSSVFCVLLICSITIFSSNSLAQTYPTKPIRIVVTTPPAGGPDIIIRLLGGKLTEALGQPIIVDNRVGASGRIGMEMVARVAPDGYTILIISGQETICEALYKDLKYNLVKDFSPISLLGTVPQLLAVNPSVPATSVKELVALAKARPGKLKYGSGGIGSNLHLSAELFKFVTGTDILHVPYKGAAPAFTGVMVGEVDMTFQSMTGLMPMIRSGKLRALGVTTAKRSPLMPDLPSISESFPGYEWFGYYGLVAPAKTPSAIISRLNSEVVKALNSSAVRERMVELGIDALGSSQHDFALFISKQVEKMREVVKLSGAKPED